MKALPIILDIVVEQYKQIILRNTSETFSSEIAADKTMSMIPLHLKVFSQLFICESTS